MTQPGDLSWNPYQAVAQAMAMGDSWLFAWCSQSSVPFRRLDREAKIPDWRLTEIDRGSPATMAEIEALARVWRVDRQDIITTLPSGAVI